MNYYPFHIGDYLSATRHLSWEEDGAYRRLLDVYYTTEKPIPLELKQACRLVLATTESQREAVATVLEEFFEKSPEGWVNHRADAEIESMRDKQQKQRDRANKRWQKPSAEIADAPAMPRHTEIDAVASKTDANALPPTPTPTPTPTPSSSVPKGTGDDPPVRPSVDKSKTELWKSAVSLLGGQGMPEPQARSLIGKLSKDYKSAGEDIVLTAVQGAVAEQPADARAYLKAACQRLAGERKRDGSHDWTAAAL
ncbi:MAG: YdaU family protein [Rhodoferax sp.]|uniref:YdaU family protein n=1 Tax=Rhodoferax sp. TaxID=50421 RepID=UPI001B4D1DC3|nr:YdaU family protein [Rhodoferax sp.]MBP9149234.1 YdaU family protein [Rhodoferax sp.]MBP9736185.1 YdaU family protein [Rhodoferax sp.]